MPEEIKVAIPEPLMMAIHIYMVTAHALARSASEQPEGIKGMPPADLLNKCAVQATKAFLDFPREERQRLLRVTAEKLAVASGAAGLHYEPYDHARN